MKLKSISQLKGVLVNRGFTTPTSFRILRYEDAKNSNAACYICGQALIAAKAFLSFEAGMQMLYDAQGNVVQQAQPRNSRLICLDMEACEQREIAKVQRQRDADAERDEGILVSVNVSDEMLRRVEGAV